MDQRRENLIRRPLYVYDLPVDILSTLQRKDYEVSKPDPYANDIISSNPKHIEKDSSNSGLKACSLCDVTFHAVEDQRSHVRSDLHRYNLKQKLRRLEPVSEADFEKLIGGEKYLDSIDDITENLELDESISGSDFSDTDEGDSVNRKETTLSTLLKKQAAIHDRTSESEDNEYPKKQRRGFGKPPLVWFSTPTLPPGTYLGIYQAIFTNVEQQNESEILEAIRQKQLSPRIVPTPHADNNKGVPLPAEYIGPHMFLCMIGGGHFAAMVVSLAPKQTKLSASGPLTREATVLAHKTFHRYTTRRKQGGAQSSNDNAKGAAHSAGADLRRYNEAALKDEVRLLLSDWKGMIDTSDLLFVRATGVTNRRTIFGPYDGQMIRPNDPRIRGFPFSTRRATQNELMRAFVELTRVKVQEINEAAVASTTAAHEADSQPSTSKPTKQPGVPTTPNLTEQEETELLHTAQIQALVRRSRLPALVSYLKSNDLSPDFLFQPTDSQQNHHAPTPLHMAASLNSPVVISGLLVKAGANPMVLNGDKKPPFDLAGDRASRDAFRVARSSLGEDAFDWEAAHVPSALTQSQADARQNQEKQEEKRQEEDRRKGEIQRLKEEGPRVVDGAVLGKAAGRGRALALGQAQRTAQETREEEARGLTPEMRLKLERERRARAAEERMKRLKEGRANIRDTE